MKLPEMKLIENVNGKENQERIYFGPWRNCLPQNLINFIDETTQYKAYRIEEMANNVENIEPNNTTKKKEKLLNWRKFFRKDKDKESKSEMGLKWRIRKYFVQEASIERDKYLEGGDIMIGNNFILVERDRVKAEEDLALSIIDFTAGSLGGFAQVIVSQPFDTIKVKQQTYPKLYKNMLKTIKLIQRTDGFRRGFYAGTKPALLASVAENSVLFTAYGRCLNLLTKILDINEVKDLSVLGFATAGFLTAFFSTFTLCPTELVKCKLQAISEVKPFLAKDGKAKTLNAWQVTREIVHQKGIAGLYQGLGSTFAREMPGLFFFFGGYEGSRIYFTEPGQSKEDIGALPTMMAGINGGVALWVSTYPVDVIKTRIQVNNIHKSMLSVAWDIITHEGFFTLYKGLLPTILRTIPASATLFWVYEYSKKSMIRAVGLE